MKDRSNPTPLEAAKKVYNSYLLLYKLNELKVDELKDNGEKKSLQEVISEAIKSSQQEVSITINEENYKVEITPEDKLKIKVLNQHTKPKVPEVKGVLEYADKDIKGIIDLWANSEVSIEKGEFIKKDQNNWAFAVDLHDQLRSEHLKVGGLGKKVPFNLRFANFYKVIEILQDESKPLKERFRLANNIATGSGKTGDIALLKLWAYLTDTPCITMVPSDTLRTQSNKFDEEFLPDKVAKAFGKPFSKINTRYATTTFDKAFITQWALLKRIYGENNKEPALILIDEPTELKERPVLMARVAYMAGYNPIAFFSATVDKFLSALFGIIWQILLSPKERTELGVGKIPVVFCEKIRQLFLREAAGASNESKNNYISPAQKYILQNETAHSIINNSSQQNFKNLSSKQFLDILSESIDSSVNKKGLIIANEAAVNNKYEHGLMNSLVDSQPKTDRKERCKESYLYAIKQLNIGLNDKDINKYIDENLEIPANYSDSLKFIPLHGLIDIAKAFLTQESKKLSDALNNINLSDQYLKPNIGKFIETKYGIDDGDGFQPKDKLANIIFNIIQHIKKKSANTEYIHSVERNYTADKKLNADIMQIDGVQDFCNDYRMISCFADSKNKIQHLANETIYYVEENKSVNRTSVKSTDIQSSGKNIEILLNMFRAGLIGNFVADKKMGVGFDDVDLDKVVCITEGPTDLLDPAYELQVLGRGGRGNQKGTYFFYRYTDSELYFDFNDVATLGGEVLKGKFEQARQSYLEDKQANIERRSVAIFDRMSDAAWCYDSVCFNDVKKTHGVFSVEGAQNWYLQKVEKILIDEFNDLNIQCGFNKSAAVEIFIKILQKIIETEGNYTGSFQNNYYQKACFRLHNQQADFARFAALNATKKLDFQYADKVHNSINTEKVNIIKNALTDLEYTKNSNSYWSCVARAPIMTWEQIVNGSGFPIFMEQKQISQNQNVFVNNAGQNTSFHNPATQSDPPQRTSTKKEVMYGFMIASPSLAVGIYALVIGAAAFNPIIAAGTFIGVAVTALVLFITVKVCEKKKETPDMATSSKVLAPECFSGESVKIS